MLLEAGAPIDAPDRFGRRPVHLAALCGHLEVLRVLRRHPEQQEDVRDDFGRGISHFAALGGHVELLSVVNAHEARSLDLSTPLHHAAMNNNTAYAAALAKQVKRAGLDSKDEQGRTPLHRVAKNLTSATALALLNANARVNATDRAGDTALHLALREEETHDKERANAGVDDPIRSDLVDQLIAYRANPTACNQAGESTLELVAKCRRRRWMDRTLGQLNDVHAFDAKGRTALHFAARFGSLEKIQQLIDRGASVRNRDRGGKTPLLYAVRHGCGADIALTLLRIGHDLEDRDMHGRMPAHLAARHKDGDLLAALIRWGAYTDVPDNNGRFPIHEAARHGSKSAVEQLVGRVDLNVWDRAGFTALDLAKDPEVIRALEAAGAKRGSQLR